MGRRFLRVRHDGRRQGKTEAMMAGERNAAAERSWSGWTAPPRRARPCGGRPSGPSSPGGDSSHHSPGNSRRRSDGCLPIRQISTRRPTPRKRATRRWPVALSGCPDVPVTTTVGRRAPGAGPGGGVPACRSAGGGQPGAREFAGDAHRLGVRTLRGHRPLPRPRLAGPRAGLVRLCDRGPLAVDRVASPAPGGFRGR